MKSKWLFQRPCSGFAALLALAALAPVPAAAAEWVFRTKPDTCVEVDGAYAPDARLLTTDGNSKFLVVDLPSLSVSVLVNLKAKKAVTIPPSLIKREATQSSMRLVGRVSADAPASELSVEGPVLRFRVDKSEVSANMESTCQATVAPSWTAGPITDDSSARKCVHLEDKPIRETAGCLKVTTMRNSCDVPVMVVVLSIQHLFSGDLPESSSIVIPPSGNHTLGCAWASGANAPTAYEVRAAAFLSKRNTPAGREAGSTGH
jgi:hypothetical protein